MRSFFNAENWLWKPLGALGDLVMLSLLWTVFSVPLITLGPASAALYDAAVHSLRRKEETVIARFLASFRRELKQGVLASLLCAAGILALSALLLTGFFTLSEREGAWELLAAALLLTAFFLLCFFSWLWPVLSRFSMGLRALFTASARLACGHILKSTAMALLWGAALWAGLRYVAPLFVLPALCACLSTYLIEPVFREYEEQE